MEGVYMESVRDTFTKERITFAMLGNFIVINIIISVLAISMQESLIFATEEEFTEGTYMEFAADDYM